MDVSIRGVLEAVTFSLCLDVWLSLLPKSSLRFGALTLWNSIFFSSNSRAESKNQDCNLGLRIPTTSKSTPAGKLLRYARSDAPLIHSCRTPQDQSNASNLSVLAASFAASSTQVNQSGLTRRGGSITSVNPRHRKKVYVQIHKGDYMYADYSNRCKQNSKRFVGRMRKVC